MLDNWQRIEQIIKWTGATSVSAFAREIGLNRGENLYQIKRGNNGISKELAEIITQRYSQISKAWLLTGEGEMLLDESAREKTAIPFYKMEALRFIMSEESLPPTYTISFPLFKKCDFAAFSFSNAMVPDIPPGAIVFFEQRFPPFAIIPGHTYLVVSPQFHGIRIIRKDPEETTIRLVARNKEEYDDVLLDLQDIQQLYLVRGIAIDKAF